MKYQLTILEEKIKSLFESIEVHTPLQLDLFVVAAKMKIPVYIGDWDSKAVKYKGIYRIALNQELPYEKQWEDFGHELCHVLNHAGDQTKMPSLFREMQEFQANHFMYHFCIPSFMLLELEFPKYRNEAIKRIAESFRVTLDFAEKRLAQFEAKVTGLEFLSQIAENPVTYEDEMPSEIDVYDDVPPWLHPDFQEFINAFPVEIRDDMLWSIKSHYYENELQQMKEEQHHESRSLHTS